MAVATHTTPHQKPADPGHAHAAHLAAPVSPGKVAMWLFLATEVMFFTGLIGSYIVLRAGSPGTAYSNKYSPGTVPPGFAGDPDVKVYNWPLPYDHATNPLSIDLTAGNTFILICSSVSMVLALAAIQRGDRATIQGTTLFLAFAVVLMNLIVDIFYAFLDPRVRY